MDEEMVTMIQQEEEQTQESTKERKPIRISWEKRQTLQ